MTPELSASPGNDGSFLVEARKSETEGWNHVVQLSWREHEEDDCQQGRWSPWRFDWAADVLHLLAEMPLEILQGKDLAHQFNGHRFREGTCG
jgi:hypothetical protein